MNATLRDSHGGGILERFDTIGTLLFLKVMDERETQDLKRSPEFILLPDDDPESVRKRLQALLQRTCERYPSLYAGSAPPLTSDAPALYRIVDSLQAVNLVSTPGDVKGLAYEELLRDTFDKSENQQYFTPHEVVEFMADLAGKGRDRVVCDPACGTGGLLVEAFRRGGTSKILGADVDERLARAAQMNLIMHGADNAIVHRLTGAGSLAPLKYLRHALPSAAFDLVVTNPPFGSDLFDRSALSELATGRQRAARRRSVLFTERCLELVRPGGKVVIVLDDSVLNLPGNADIRAVMQDRALIEAVVSLPDVTFMPYSSAKCSIVVLRRKAGAEGQKLVFMAEATKVGRRPNGDPLYIEDRDLSGQRLLANDLPSIAEEFRAFRQGKEVCHQLCFTTRLPLGANRLDIFQYHPKRIAAQQELAESRWPTPALRELVTVRRQRISPAQELGESTVNWIGLAEIEERSGEFQFVTIRADRIKSQANAFRAGDILFSRLRPALRKVILIPESHEGGYCSAELLVLSTSTHAGVLPEYLAFILRSDLVYGQVVNQVTGLGRPRVSQESVLSLRIPLPIIEEQEKIVARMSLARARALSARERAARWLTRSATIMEAAYESALSDLSAKAARR
ncbi:MAG: N-6 DNA methylase [Opitutaceae bacterium]